MIPTEEWRLVPRYEGRYLVSDFGRVISTISKKVLRPQDNGCGYKVLYLRNKEGILKCEVIHRLVAEAFIENPRECRTVNHKDGDKTNNHLSNLEWMTHKENIRHAMETGLVTQIGEQHTNAKLTNEDVRTIRTLFGTEKITNIAKRYNVSRNTIHCIKNGTTWKHIV